MQVMAEEELKKELNCSICLDIYTDPKILQCFHVYCQKCLVRLVEKDEHEKLSLPCPTCRQVTPVPAKGTTGLPSAFQTNRLLEILDKHQKAESDLGTEKVRSIHCSEHDGREVELFCETCEELLCYKCVIQGGKHHSHDYKDISESFEIYKEQLVPSLRPLKKKLRTIARVLSQLDRNCDEVIQQQGVVQARIRDSCKHLHEIISRRQTELIGQLYEITKEKLNRLATQKAHIETLQAQLNSCVEFTRESLKTRAQQHEVLLMKTGILQQVKELAIPFKPHSITPITETVVVYSASADTIGSCEKFGRICTFDSPDPSKCVGIGKGTEEAEVGKKTTANIKTVSYSGEPCTRVTASTSLKVELVSCLTGRKIHGAIERSIEGSTIISYKPVVKGRHKLNVKTDGEHIAGSPFSVLVKQPVEKLGSPIRAQSGSLCGPTDVAINENGEVIVTDRCMDHVTVFTPHGRKIRSFGKHGSQDGQFDEVFGVTVDRERNIIMSEIGNHRIQKFNSEGAFLKAVGCIGSGRLQFNKPHGISYNASNDKIYVSDSLNHRIQVLNSDLSFYKTFGKEGTGKGQFEKPIGLATDSAGDVYVADYSSHCVQIFTAEGKFLRTFGCIRTLYLPFGIAVDISGLVYVSELYTHRVSVFSSEGHFVASFGSKGAKQGQFMHPYGLAVDDAGVVCVCDIGNQRIQIF